MRLSYTPVHACAPKSISHPIAVQTGPNLPKLGILQQSHVIPQVVPLVIFALQRSLTLVVETGNLNRLCCQPEAEPVQADCLTQKR